MTPTELRTMTTELWQHATALMAHEDGHRMADLNAQAWDINAVTGFANGDRFETAAQVRDYFTRENLHAMVGVEQYRGPDGEDLAPSQEQLDRWASLVIEHRWHCLDEFAD